MASIAHEPIPPKGATTLLKSQDQQGGRRRGSHHESLDERRPGSPGARLADAESRGERPLAAERSC